MRETPIVPQLLTRETKGQKKLPSAEGQWRGRRPNPYRPPQIFLRPFVPKALRTRRFGNAGVRQPSARANVASQPKATARRRRVPPTEPVSSRSRGASGGA